MQKCGIGAWANRKTKCRISSTVFGSSRSLLPLSVRTLCFGGVCVWHLCQSSFRRNCFSILKLRMVLKLKYGHKSKKNHHNLANNNNNASYYCRCCCCRHFGGARCFFIRHIRTSYCRHQATSEGVLSCVGSKYRITSQKQSTYFYLHFILFFSLSPQLVPFFRLARSLQRVPFCFLFHFVFIIFVLLENCALLRKTLFWSLACSSGATHAGPEKNGVKLNKLNNNWRKRKTNAKSMYTRKTRPQGYGANSKA